MGNAPSDAGYIISGVNIVDFTGYATGEVAAKVESSLGHFFLSNIAMQGSTVFNSA
jgi:hypothetical protein